MRAQSLRCVLLSDSLDSPDSFSVHGIFQAKVLEWVAITGSLFEFPEPYSKFALAIYFTYGNVSFRVTLSMREGERLYKTFWKICHFL